MLVAGPQSLRQVNICVGTDGALLAASSWDAAQPCHSGAASPLLRCSAAGETCVSGEHGEPWGSPAELEDGPVGSTGRTWGLTLPGGVWVAMLCGRLCGQEAEVLLGVLISGVMVGQTLLSADGLCAPWSLGQMLAGQSATREKDTARVMLPACPGAPNGNSFLFFTSRSCKVPLGGCAPRGTFVTVTVPVAPCQEPDQQRDQNCEALNGGQGNPRLFPSKAPLSAASDVALCCGRI